MSELAVTLTKKQMKQVPDLIQAALSGETKNVLAMIKKNILESAIFILTHHPP